MSDPHRLLLVCTRDIWSPPGWLRWLPWADSELQPTVENGPLFEVVLEHVMLLSVVSKRLPECLSGSRSSLKQCIRSICVTRMRMATCGMLSTCCGLKNRARVLCQSHHFRIV